MAGNHARWLARGGAVLFLLSLINGLLTHAMTLLDRAIAAHLAGLIGSALLFGLASLWPRLDLTSRLSAAGVCLALYGFVGGWVFNFLAAVTGHFGIFPLSVTSQPGGGAADALMSAALLSIALVDIALAVVVLWGLRGKGEG